MPDRIATAFLSHAAIVLTSDAYSGSKLVEVSCAYAVDFGVDIPHARYPFDAPNKRTALLDNLARFQPKQQYQIIKEMCDRLDPAGERPSLVALKVKLMSDYRQFAEQDQNTDLHRTLIVETRHWLAAYPEVRKLFDESLNKHDHGMFRRNTLDDLRLALELLCKSLFNNHSSLEHQIGALGRFVKDRGGSSELANMFAKLVDYYAKYQNTYVKHDDAVITAEVEFVFELTASFIKHLLRLSKSPLSRSMELP